MYANLTLNSYQVNLSVGSGGSASASSINVYYGLTNTFTVTPNAGYYLESLSCDNGYTASGFTTTTSSTGVQTVTISNNNKLNGATCTIKFKALCPYSSGELLRTFDYKGYVESFQVKSDGLYKLKVCGAQGGAGYSRYYYNGSGGYGGCSVRYVYLTKDTTLYVAVGGAGENNGDPRSNGGYNGGGQSGPRGGNMAGGGGGGATHIATTNRGVLANYSSYRSEVLIVAGGGGGGSGYHDSDYDDDGDYIGFPEGSWHGGAGGGEEGKDGGGGTYNWPGTAGTQTGSGVGFQYDGVPGGFGYGGGAGSAAGGSAYSGGGGGGWYGGRGGGQEAGGGGGSGYIGSATTIYNGRTFPNSSEPGQKSGNGSAEISFETFE